MLEPALEENLDANLDARHLRICDWRRARSRRMRSQTGRTQRRKHRRGLSRRGYVREAGRCEKAGRRRRNDRRPGRRTRRQAGRQQHSGPSYPQRRKRLASRGARRRLQGDERLRRARQHPLTQIIPVPLPAREGVTPKSGSPSHYGKRISRMLTVKPESRQNLANGHGYKHRGGDKARLRGSFIGLLGSTIVRVVFSDESGVGDDSQPLTVVTAILLNLDNQWDPVRRELEFTRVATPRNLLNRKYLPGEFKGDLLFKGLRNKINRVRPSKAAEILCRILLLIPKHSIHIFHGAVDRAGAKNFVRRTTLTLTDAEQAFSECLGQLANFAYAFLPKEKVLWIADRNKYENLIKEGLNFHRLIPV